MHCKVEQSSTARMGEENGQSVAVVRDVPYLGSGRCEKLDLYWSGKPDRKDLRPGIVIIHGGGFYTQSKSDAREQSIAMDLTRHGYVCASIDYRLVDLQTPPEAASIWPLNLHDCKAAVRFLRDHGRRWGVDPARIGAIGSSSGGRTAAMLGCNTADLAGLDPPATHEPALYRVQAVICLYPVSDLTGWLHGSTRWTPGWDAVARMMGGTAEELPDVYRKASPIYCASFMSTPILIIHGTADEVVPCEQSVQFAEGLREAGANYQLILVPDAPHSFDLHPPQQDLASSVLTFLEVRLK